MATPEGTEGFDGTGYRDLETPDGVLTLSSVGLGTYLGDADEETDEAYRRSVARALELGCNVVDTAINYRHQRSERSVGRALRDADVDRDEVFVATKGGYMPFRFETPDDPSGYLRREFVDTGLAPPDEVVDANCISPGFLRSQVERSLDNLGVDSVDLYYVHNPETHLAAEGVDDDEFDRRLRRAFEALEEAIEEGRIGAYGVATWNGFRVPKGRDDHLSMERVVEIARGAADGDPSLAAVQLPYNAGMTEAAERETQTVYGEDVTPLEAAEELGLYVFASASLMQGRLAREGEGVDMETAGAGDDATPAQRALGFVRSTECVGTALVGTSDVGHVEENLAVMDASGD